VLFGDAPAVPVEDEDLLKRLLDILVIQDELLIRNLVIHF